MLRIKLNEIIRHLDSHGNHCKAILLNSFLVRHLAIILLEVTVSLIPLMLSWKSNLFL